MWGKTGRNISFYSEVVGGRFLVYYFQCLSLTFSIIKMFYLCNKKKSKQNVIIFFSFVIFPQGNSILIMHKVEQLFSNVVEPVCIRTAPKSAILVGLINFPLCYSGNFQVQCFPHQSCLWHKLEVLNFWRPWVKFLRKPILLVAAYWMR